MNTACIIFTGALFSNGYGNVNGKRAHRLTFAFIHGPIAAGLLVLHRCNVRACVNPDHLYLGTQKDNIQQAVREGRMANQQKTHCPKGHPLGQGNLILRPTKQGGISRVCRECHIQRKRNVVR